MGPGGEREGSLMRDEVERSAGADGAGLSVSI